jgi:hypothetical protein
LNPHELYGSQGPQPCASTNSAIPTILGNKGQYRYFDLPLESLHSNKAISHTIKFPYSQFYMPANSFTV